MPNGIGRFALNDINELCDTLSLMRQNLEARTKIGAGGRIVIPAAYRRAMGLKVGDQVIMRLEDGEVRIISRQAAIRRAQERVARYIKHDRSAVDWFIAERRREAAREDTGE